MRLLNKFLAKASIHIHCKYGLRIRAATAASQGRLQFSAFDEKKQREFETVFFSHIRELQTKIGVVEAIRQELLLLSDVEEADQDKVKLEETINKFNAAWSETRVMYKDVVDRVDFSIHEYSTESLDQNKLQKILIDIGERPTTKTGIWHL